MSERILLAVLAVVARRPRVAAASTLGLAVAVLSLMVGGCPGGDDQVVAGTVTSGGEPVVSGTVTALASDGRAYQANIRPDGTYELSGLPPGPVRVGVFSPPPAGASPPVRPPPAGAGAGAADGVAPPAAEGEAPPENLRAIAASANRLPLPPPPPADPDLARRWFPIPVKYTDPNKSGLTGEVSDGRTPLDIKVD